MNKFKMILAMLIMFPMAFAMAQTVEVTASWSAPTTGSPVETYILQVSENGGPFYDYATTSELSITLDLNNLSTYTARVAGRDALDRQGSWSDPSDPYLADIGLPGAPGKPLIMGS